MDHRPSESPSSSNELHPTGLVMRILNICRQHIHFFLVEGNAQSTWHRYRYISSRHSMHFVFQRNNKPQFTPVANCACLPHGMPPPRGTFLFSLQTSFALFKDSIWHMPFFMTHIAIRNTSNLNRMPQNFRKLFELKPLTGEDVSRVVETAKDTNL